MRTLLRPSASRIHRTDAWKQSAYAFVPYETHFGELCGFADDVVAAGQGFGMHPHRDMEISTVMLTGAQRHQDSTGSTQLVESNMVQTMSAGTGIRHSEVNASAVEAFHSFQIWVYPKNRATAPRHEAFRYEPPQKRDRFLLALSPDRRQASALIGADAFLSVASLTAGSTHRYALRAPGNGLYLHCAAGAVQIAGQVLGAGDAIGLWDLEGCDVVASEASDCELVLVEVPMQRGVHV